MLKALLPHYAELLPTLQRVSALFENDDIQLLLEELKLLREQRSEFLREKQRHQRDEALNSAQAKFYSSVWFANPLNTWQHIKGAMSAMRPVRVADERSRYRGYLFRVNGNRFAIMKHGKEKWVVTYAQLMGLCLNCRLYLDDDRWPMPSRYEKYVTLAKEGRL